MISCSIACIGGEGGISRGWFDVPLEEDLAELPYNLEGTHEGNDEDDDASHTHQFGQKLDSLGGVSGGFLLRPFLFEGLLLPGQGVVVIKIFGRERPCITISFTSAVTAAIAALVIVLVGVRLVCTFGDDEVWGVSWGVSLIQTTVIRLKVQAGFLHASCTPYS